MSYIVITLTLLAFCWVMFLQIYNLVKYRETNGALRQRLILMGICICLTGHALMRFEDKETMYFLFLASLGFVWLYHGFNKKGLTNQK